jgi:hypothetical protein
MENVDVKVQQMGVLRQMLGVAAVIAVLFLIWFVSRGEYFSAAYAASGAALFAVAAFGAMERGAPRHLRIAFVATIVLFNVLVWYRIFSYLSGNG